MGCESASPGEESAIQFIDVTADAGLDEFVHTSGAVGDKWFPEIMGAGGGFIDIDGDGWQDILLVGGASWQNNAVPAVSLYRNLGDGSFANHTTEAGLDDQRAFGFGLAVGDIDNDADEDFVLTTLEENLLFRNEKGRFVAEKLDEAGSWSTAVMLVDTNNDGWLDILAGNYVKWSAEQDRTCTLTTVQKEYCTPELYDGAALQFYQNQGDGTFQSAAHEAGFDGHPGKTLGMAMLDYNEDGAIDIVVTNDTARDLLFENQGDGTFEEKGLISGIALTGTGKASAGMGVDVGDVDGSGNPAILIGNFSKEMISVFQYRGNNRFRDAAVVSGIGRPSLLSLTFGLSLVDAELDGDLDLFVINGHVHEGVEALQEGITFAQSPQLFSNDGEGKFTLHAASEIPDAAIVGRAAAYADYDNDGDQDFLVTTNGGPAFLWQNQSIRAGALLQVSLQSRDSNKSAIGARVELKAEGKTQIRYVSTGGSYLAASEKRLTFGLGASATVDSMLIRWPSGIRDTLRNLPLDAHVSIIEGTGQFDVIRRF